VAPFGAAVLLGFDDNKCPEARDERVQVTA
jgi:hypothetical protein